MCGASGMRSPLSRVRLNKKDQVSPGSGRSSLLGGKDSLCKDPGAALESTSRWGFVSEPLSGEGKKMLGFPEPDLICLRGGL